MPNIYVVKVKTRDTEGNVLRKPLAVISVDKIVLDKEGVVITDRNEFKKNRELIATKKWGQGSHVWTSNKSYLEKAVVILLELKLHSTSSHQEKYMLRKAVRNRVWDEKIL